MGNVLKVDTATVRSVSNDLSRITTELADAQAHADDVADAVGHDGLAGALRHFSSSWDDRRRKLVEQITQLRDTATSIADGLDGTDSELARALERTSDTQAPAPRGTAHGAAVV